MATRVSNRLFSHKLNEVPVHLQTPTFALKWCEEIKKPPAVPIIVNLSIDSKGFYLICVNRVKKEVECFDLALIHDTRTGSQVSLPQGGVEYFDQNHIGLLDVPVTSKWLTIYYGNTFVASELRIVHFYFESPSLAREWTEKLFQLGHNQILRNLSSLDCLEKIHSKIIHGLIDLDKRKIPVRNLVQFLCKNNRDSSKVREIHQRLESLKLNIIDSTIDPNEFTFNKFFSLYMNLIQCHEIEKLFNAIGGIDCQYLNVENVKVFLKKQKETLNDATEMDLYEIKANDVIKKYSEHDEYEREKGMSNESFLRYLLSFDNLIVDPKKFDLCMNMDKPLAHYFISSSHNTYLTGYQWTGRSSIEMYRQVLLTGCRCIELDVLDSEKKSDEPEIKHKNTPVKPVLFIEVIVAIKEYAFKVTPYPLVLSIENHCSAKTQAKMAQYFVDVFGKNLITEPLKTHPCDGNYPLPSPNDLKYKILIKNKKISTNSPSPVSNNNNHQIGNQTPDAISATTSSDTSSDIGKLRCHQQLLNASPRHCFLNNDPDELAECTDVNEKNSSENPPSDGDTICESKATKAMSDLVHYLVPVSFKSFAKAEQLSKSFEMSSFSEDRALSLIREQAKEFVAYNQRQISRIYPRGTRLESSNYNPYMYWLVGCQMCALNYQTLDVPMQLNLGLFSFNNACGYIEKPPTLCQLKNSFDPKARTNVENVAGYEIDIKVISGQFLCQDREPTFVDVQLYGMYGDMNKRHEFLVRSKHWNGFQAIYDNTSTDSNKYPIRFPNVSLPDMAGLRFAVSSEDGTFIGQSFIPIAHIQPGYRYVVLRNQMNIPINASSLFIFIRINIHIKPEDQEIAKKLVQPLTNQPIHKNKLEQDLNKQTSCEDIVPTLLVRNHSSTSMESAVIFREQTEKISTNETKMYEKHLVPASRLHDRKTLCKVLSLHDILTKEIIKGDRNMESKLRRVSVDFHKKIEKQEARFQQCLNLQHDQAYSHGERPRTASVIQGKDVKESEETLLELYSTKFHLQEELECKNFNEYYKAVDGKIKADYNKQMRQIDNILQEEKNRVNEEVKLQKKKEEIEIEKTENNRDNVLKLKGESVQSNSKASACLIQKLELMHEEVKDILTRNLKTNLNEIEEYKCMELQKCLEKYYNRFERVQYKLQQWMKAAEAALLTGSSLFPHNSRMKISTSLCALSYPSEEVTKTNSEP
ncbi:unnamed protein product [Rotaria socialis]|uniref:1-phosphatidylinositol 4,5-bisphosphate phosphodiesterase n=1 Tax=Rotaria socialis TaxID=392032 RepID=A0A819AS98_9BILA|nr:unnamed protein product [Rotaria socialis]CAF4809668.1 unnamed protein product [Rotaria socialis]